ncbi:MGMT family protein [Gynuella sunshinyii]|uniref:Putative methylated DNA-protein cysteine methyltransferase n=1 Tax=Gynuella sunshinyii YC6258 TaxID=1445510 RepID=A0A0C5V6Y4_9GAMM|nr:MGMT family protein [Gynuella sunshinyii]AJQ95180.1 putative methylated DNA-protein cysteine methyltransferase [Gynuella sunshinyii YC6258]
MAELSDERYLAIYSIIGSIPKGQVISYGAIAKMVPNCSARMVARALRITPEGSKLPWYRVINSQMKVSDHPGAKKQRQLLEQEGVTFDPNGKIAREHHWLQT